MTLKGLTHCKTNNQPILHNSPVNLEFRKLKFIFFQFVNKKNGIIWALDSEKWTKILKIGGCMNNFIGDSAVIVNLL